MKMRYLDATIYIGEIPRPIPCLRNAHAALKYLHDDSHVDTMLHEALLRRQPPPPFQDARQSNRALFRGIDKERRGVLYPHFRT
jgi:hypothetical protein